MKSEKNYISIKPIKQIDPMECSIACLRMVLDYYGVSIQTKEIYDSIVRDLSGGSFNTEIARFAKMKGFKVECFSYHLGLFDPSDVSLSKEDLIKKLNTQMKNPWFSKEWSLLTNSIIQALKNGVDYIIKIPSRDIILTYLKNKVPLIASVSYAALHNKQGDIFEGHDVVLNGFDKESVLFVDPEYAKEEKIDFDQLMFAIASRRAVSTSAYLVAIDK